MCLQSLFCIRIRFLLAGSFLMLAPLLFTEGALAATAPGQVISTTSTASYTDANATALSTTSNTVQVTVQNAPSVTVVSTGVQTVMPSMIVVDNFTVTNTGNATGQITLDTLPVQTGSAGTPTILGYTLSGSTCVVAAAAYCTTLGLENALTGMSGISAGAAVTIGVVYQLTALTSTVGQNVITTLHAEMIYAGSGTGWVAETSADTTGVATDTVGTDARLDVQTSVTGPSSSGGTIAWVVKVNNGGSNPAMNLASAKAALNNLPAAAGIVIFVPMPVYSSTALILQAQPTTPTVTTSTGSPTVVLYYNPTSCSTSGSWATTGYATATCVAIYISGGTSGELSATNASTAGSVATPQLTLNFVTNQPTGTGAGNANSVNLVATGAVGGVVWATGPTPILGQGVTMGTPDAATASLLSGIESNALSSSGIIAPGGASNASGSQAYSSQVILNGPYLNQALTGSYPGGTNLGVAAATNMLDFTALNVPCTSNSTTSVNGLACTVNSVIIVNTAQNAGNAVDTGVVLKATAQTGWKVQLWNVSGCSATASQSFNGAGCTVGTSLTPQSAGTGDTVTSPTPQTLAALGTLNYEAVYTPVSTVTAFTIYDATLTVAGTSGTGVDTNDTHNELIPGGIVKLQNVISTTTANCPAGETAPTTTLVCPGGTLLHSITYSNIVPFATIANLGSESATFASNACYTAAGALTITDDGAASPDGATAANNWATYTNGIASPGATDTLLGGGTIFTYGANTPGTFVTGQTKLTAQPGGASYKLAPGGTGTISFSTIVQ
jgi:hypothetical protein